MASVKETVNKVVVEQGMVKDNKIPSSAGGIGDSVGSVIDGNVTEKGLDLLEDDKK